MVDQLAKSQLAQDWQARIENLELKQAFQDDMIEQLNHELAVHQQEIAELKQQIKLIVTRLKEATPDAGIKPQDEPPPPHY